MHVYAWSSPTWHGLSLAVFMWQTCVRRPHQPDARRRPHGGGHSPRQVQAWQPGHAGQGHPLYQCVFGVSLHHDITVSALLCLQHPSKYLFCSKYVCGLTQPSCDCPCTVCAEKSKPTTSPVGDGAGGMGSALLDAEWDGEATCLSILWFPCNLCLHVEVDMCTEACLTQHVCNVALLQSR